MVEFPRYDNYKDSSIEWLGEIPNHWYLGRLKNSVESCINGVWGNDLDAKQGKIVTCVRVADFNRSNFRVSLDKETKRKISINDFSNRSLKKGDLLLEKSGGGDLQLVGQVVIYDYDISAVCSNFVERMRIKDSFSSRYLTYYHSYLYSIKINYKHIKQTTGIQNLDSNSYLSESFFYPPLEEQQKIADFLDRKTAEIDEAREKTKIN